MEASTIFDDHELTAAGANATLDIATVAVLLFDDAFSE